MALLVKTALTITLNLGSIKTMSEALPAASVASSIAIPICAHFNAGASLTQSPVIPQIWFLPCSLLTISYLCSTFLHSLVLFPKVFFRNNFQARLLLHGKTPKKPSAFFTSSSIGKPDTFASLLSPRREEDGYMLVPIPVLRDVSFPMASW